MGNKKKEILISFFNAVIKLPSNTKIEDVNILNPYQLPILEDGKATILDVKATNNLGNTFIEEMQVTPSSNFQKRVTYYLSQSYSQQIDKGEDYSKLFPVYFIGILDFDFSSEPKYFSTHKIQDVETKEIIFSDMEFNIIELIKFKKDLT